MSPRNRFILLAGLAGAALGAAAAWTYLKSQETGLWTSQRQDGKNLTIQAGVSDFFRVGLAVFGIVRQLQAMAKRG